MAAPPPVAPSAANNAPPNGTLPPDNGKSSVSWRDVLIVLAVGIFGGLAAGILTQATHGGLFGAWPWYLDFPAEMLLGGIAGLGGVFLAMGAFTLTPKTVFVALLCGLFWNPTLTGLKNYSRNYVGKVSADSAKAAENQLNNLSGQTSEAAGNQVHNAVSTITQPLSNLNQIPQPQDKTAILNAANGVINKVVAAPTVAPSVKVEALKTIGSSVTSFDTKQRAITALDMLASQNPALKQDTAAAIKSIQQQNTSPQ